jgi:hypothetical protein
MAVEAGDPHWAQATRLPGKSFLTGGRRTRRATLRKLNAVATYSKRRVPKASKTVRKTFLSHKSK